VLVDMHVSESCCSLSVKMELDREINVFAS